jgi:hypothetical protein
VDEPQLSEFDFRTKLSAGILVTAGGFENRATAFARQLSKRSHFSEAVVFHYENQRNDNESGFCDIRRSLKQVLGLTPMELEIDADQPIDSCRRIRKAIRDLAAKEMDRSAVIDVSGMTHLWALGAVHACLANGFRTRIIYTESKSYYPRKGERRKVVKSWRDRNYKEAAKYLQSAGLGSVQILPEFGGNFRPGKRTCLIIFVGFEPNRIEGLVDAYAPGALIVLYGVSPHEEFSWRTPLSKELHAELFQRWYVRESEVSTLTLPDISRTLEGEFQAIRDHYDIAVAPECSKMQALASYMFWRRHPEVQLVFTSPVRFNPAHYSWGTGRTFSCEICP